jgi:hypothetical protein
MIIGSFSKKKFKTGYDIPELERARIRIRELSYGSIHIRMYVFMCTVNFHMYVCMCNGHIKQVYMFGDIRTLTCMCMHVRSCTAGNGLIKQMRKHSLMSAITHEASYYDYMHLRICVYENSQRFDNQRRNTCTTDRIRQTASIYQSPLERHNGKFMICIYFASIQYCMYCVCYKGSTRQNKQKKATLFYFSTN